MGLTLRLVLLGFSALVPAFAIQAYDEYTLRRDREAEVHRQALGQAKLAASELDRIFVGIRNLLLAVSKAPSVQALNSGACVPYLAALRPEFPQLLTISAMDLSGRLRCLQEAPPENLNVLDRGYFQEAMRGTPFVVGEYTLGRLSGAPVLPLAVPMRDAGGAVIGVVAASLDLQWLTAQMRERGYPEGGSVTVADRNGVILAREPLPEKFIGTAIPEAFRHLLTEPEPGTLEVISQDGTRRILGYVPLSAPPSKLYVSSGIPSRQAFAAVNAATRRGAVLLGIGLVLALATALVAGRIFIKRPVDRLLVAAEAWRRGDYAARTGLTLPGGEISRIGAVFDSVAADVERRDDALKESEARLRSLADNLPGGMIYQLAADAGGNRRFLYVSEGVERVLGLKSADVVADPAVLYAMVFEADVPLLVAAEAEALADGSPFNVELRMRRADGELRWFRLASAPRTGSDGIAVWDGVGLDVTGRKIAEQELRALADTLEQRVAERTDELAAANRQLVAQIEEREKVEATLRQMQRLEAVGQLTSGVAHDFNNLLTVVLGNVGFLERLDLDPKSRRRMATLRAAAERGAKLTAQLLAFSRRQRLEPQRLDLNETVSGMTDLLQNTVGGSLRLEIRLRQDLWPALVDPTQIELVILNLAINARDAMPVGGSLIVETENRTVTQVVHRPGEPAPGDYVVITVADTGTGMSEAVLAKAFEPFFTTKAVGKGSGLGLAQVYGFAKQSGGGVRIATAPDAGTRIEVFLPRADAGAAPEPARAPVVSPSRADPDRGVILLVDDDPAVREITGAILQDLGYAVVEAAGGGAALRILAERGDIELLLVDFAMPGMNGADVAREARARRPGLPVLFVTGYADLGALEAVGEDHVIQKPYRGDELSRKILDALRGRPLPSANVVPLKR